jgi:hypothetical protein
MHGKDRCVMHYSDNAVRFGSRGGRRRAVFNPGGLPEFSPPQTPRDMLMLLAQTIVEVRSAKIDHRTANSIAYLGASFLRAIEVADLDARVRVLEGKREGKT